MTDKPSVPNHIFEPVQSRAPMTGKSAWFFGAHRRIEVEASLVIERINQCVSLSGIEPIDDVAAVFDLYNFQFFEKLKSIGPRNDVDFGELLEKVGRFRSVGDFLDEPEKQLAELAMFGLVLLDRIAQLDWGRVDPILCFLLHDQMAECLDYLITDDRKIVRARMAAKARFEINLQVKEFVLQEWSNKRQDHNNNKTEFAKVYASRIRNEFKDKKGDPLKISEKTIREVWLSGTPNAGNQARLHVAGGDTKR